jgi:hypothetical protein
MPPERTDAGSSEDPDDSEAAQGGADAVQNTGGVVGSGTDPDAIATGDVQATVPAGNGVNWIAWVAVLAAVLFAVIYGLGIFH